MFVKQEFRRVAILSVKKGGAMLKNNFGKPIKASFCLPGVLILREAGGKATDFKGKDWKINITDVVASNSKIHNQLLKIIK